MSTELLPGKLGSSQFAKSVEKQDGWTEHQKVFPQEFKKKKKKSPNTLKKVWEEKNYRRSTVKDQHTKEP